MGENIICSRRMKLTLLACLVSLLPYLVQSDPQITQSCAGSHCGQNNVGNPAGPVARNCVGSHCVQNNAGRRKREIVAEILAEAVDNLRREERSAPSLSHGHDGGHHQVHVPRVHVPHINIPPVHIPDVHIPDVHIPDVHIPDVNVPHVQVPDVHVPTPQHHQPAQHHQSSQHHESPQFQKRSADPQISQNCAGSQCNQNNVAAGGFNTGFFPSIAQNCVGSACNQNNVLGRRKRDVVAQLIEEAHKIAEEEVEAEEAVSRKKRQISQNCVGSLCNQNNIAGGGHGVFSGAGFHLPSISQNCVGSACNQNNLLGRRKREIIAALLVETS